MDYQEYKTAVSKTTRRAMDAVQVDVPGVVSVQFTCAEEAPRRPLPSTWLTQLPSRSASRVPARLHLRDDCGEIIFLFICRGDLPLKSG